MKSSLSIHQKLCVAEAVTNLLRKSALLQERWHQRRTFEFPNSPLSRRTRRVLNELATQCEANAESMHENATHALVAVRQEKFGAGVAALTKCGEALVFDAAAEVVAAWLLEHAGKEPHAGSN